jgi:hypothetical protein
MLAFCFLPLAAILEIPLKLMFLKESLMTAQKCPRGFIRIVYKIIFEYEWILLIIYPKA